MRKLHIAAVLATLALIISGCGAGDDTAATTTTSMPPGMEMDDGHDHEHDHGDAATAMAWDGEDTPTVVVTVEGDPGSGYDIRADVTGFRFSEPTATDHVPGWGHTHVFLDGQLVSMSYEPVVHVDDLEPGTHTVRVTLSRNDHVDYAIDGVVIAATAEFTVPGEVVEPDAVIEMHAMGDTISGVEDRVEVAVGDLVELGVHSDGQHTIHVHGYDVFLETVPGEWSRVRFVADVPGIFEVEVEESGELVFELVVS